MIVIALAIVLLISGVWLRRDEQNDQIAELRDLAVPLLVESGLITRERIAPRVRPVREEVVSELFVHQAEDMEIRILVLGPDGLVLLDTDNNGSLTGQTLEPYASTVARVSATANKRNDFFSVPLRNRNRPEDEPFRDQIVLIAAAGQLPTAGGGANVLMLVEPSRTAGVVARFLPPLLLALALALLIALATGYVISRRLAGPVTRMTTASLAMAGGDLAQRVPDEGPDEIGRLATSFNVMSHRVAATDRAQRTLLADVSHELRTPLTNVDGYAHALRDGMFQTELERSAALETISAEAGRMMSLLNDLLELARLESGQAVLDFRPVNVASLLGDAARRFTAQAAKKGISLRIDAPPALTLQADQDRLHRVLDNLITNALLHTDHGGRIDLIAHHTTPKAGPESSRQIHRPRHRNRHSTRPTRANFRPLRSRHRRQHWVRPWPPDRQATHRTARRHDRDREPGRHGDDRYVRPPYTPLRERAPPIPTFSHTCYVDALPSMEPENGPGIATPSKGRHMVGTIRRSIVRTLIVFAALLCLAPLVGFPGLSQASATQDRGRNGRGELCAGAARMTVRALAQLDGALEDLVDDGTLTREQADIVATSLTDGDPGAVTATVSAAGPAARCARIAHSVGVTMQTVSDLLGIEWVEIRERLYGGESLAEIAESTGVSRDELVATLQEQVAKRLDAAEEAGRLTSEERSEREDAARVRIERLIDRHGTGEAESEFGGATPESESV